MTIHFVISGDETMKPHMFDMACLYGVCGVEYILHGPGVACVWRCLVEAVARVTGSSENQKRHMGSAAASNLFLECNSCRRG
jgi:hypothetical protein